MTVKILTYDFPLDIEAMQEDIDKLVDDGYIIIESIVVPEIEDSNRTHRAQLLITLKQYTATLFSGPYTFNICGDV